MINRSSPEYQEAKWRVKIGHAFLEKGHDIKGVIHVGANDGYEVEYYLRLGIEHVMCFEPYDLACKAFKEKYKNEIASGKVRLYEFALGDRDETRVLHVAPAGGQGSSLSKVRPEFDNVSPFMDTAQDKFGTQNIQVKRFDSFILINDNINMDDYDCLVVDTQGTELQVLRGFGVYLSYLKYLNIECSEKPVYEEEVPASEVIEYLKGMGYHQDTPIEPHNDIMFTKL